MEANDSLVVRSNKKPVNEAVNIWLKKRDYQYVENTKKEQLIELYNTKNFTVKYAAELLNINYSTAKQITQKYKGTIPIDENHTNEPFTLEMYD